MGRKKDTRGVILIWAGMALLTLATVIDVVAFFSDSGRMLLISIPLWVLGILCFVVVGRSLTET